MRGAAHTHLGNICPQNGRIGAAEVGRRADEQFSVLRHQRGDVRVRIERALGNAFDESRVRQVVHLPMHRNDLEKRTG